MIPVIVPKRSKALSWATFERRYLPVYDGENVSRDYRDPAIMSADESLVWTIVDCEGKSYVVPGFATVNYMGRVLCQRPYSETEWGNPGYIY
jgi:hypothetical protein